MLPIAATLVRDRMRETIDGGTESAPAGTAEAHAPQRRRMTGTSRARLLVAERLRRLADALEHRPTCQS